MSAVISVRVPREVAEKIKKMVESDVYPNRSTLIREALRRLTVSEGINAQKKALGKATATIASAMITWNEKSVTDVILFGSVARGKATAESDVDLLILVETADAWRIRQRLYDLIYPIIPALGINISLIVINRKRFIHMLEESDSFSLSVMSEGIQLHGGLLDEYNKSTSGKGP